MGKAMPKRTETRDDSNLITHHLNIQLCTLHQKKCMSHSHLTEEAGVKFTFLKILVHWPPTYSRINRLIICFDN